MPDRQIDPRTYLLNQLCARCRGYYTDGRAPASGWCANCAPVTVALREIDGLREQNDGLAVAIKLGGNLQSRYEAALQAVVNRCNDGVTSANAEVYLSVVGDIAREALRGVMADAKD